MDHQRVALLNGTVALATRRADGTVFVEHLPRFLEPALVVANPKTPPKLIAPILNPAIPNVPVSDSVIDAVLDLVPDLNSYTQDIDPQRVKVLCPFREARRHPSATDAELAAICEAQSGQSQIGGILEDIVPVIVVAGGALIAGGALGGIIGSTVDLTGEAGLVGAAATGTGGVVRVPGTPTPPKELLPGVSNTVLAVASFGIAGLLLLLFFI